MDDPFWEMNKMKKKVVLYKQIQQSELQKLKQHFDLTYFPRVHEQNKGEFIASLKDAEGIIGASLPFNSELLKQASQLKVASTISVGTDRYDIDHLNKRNIPLMHTPAVLSKTTADTIFALVMCTARRITELSNIVKNGQWEKSIDADLFGVDVHGKTMGIVGMGRIGYELGKRAFHGFDMKINYFNRSESTLAEDKLNATKMELSQLLSESDFVCVVLPLTEKTNKLIGKMQFELMKPSAIFINAGRGGVVDEEAMIDALQAKKIRAVGLDVFEVEPLPATSPLCQMDNAVLLPHIGSATTETRAAMESIAVDNLIAALNGDLTKNCANVQQLRTG